VLFAGAINALPIACGSDHAVASRGTDASPEAGALFSQTADGGGLFGSVENSRCITQLNQAEALPLDLYVLFDQSGSMSTPADQGNRLDAIRAAFADFIGAKETSGIGVGLGYFGNQPLGQASCAMADYETPAVSIGLLPAQSNALLESLASVVPTGETPTGPAIRGACTYVQSWKTDHPGRALDLLLLTDGVPEAPISRANGCDPTLEDAVSATRACVADADISLYVLGVGPNLDNLNQIAAAGRSGQAYLVNGTNVQTKVLDALDAIRGTALPCSFAIPPAPEGQTLDRDRVNVVVTDVSGKKRALGNVPNSTACGVTGGWYYVPGDTSERVELCDVSCKFVKSQSNGGAIEFALGCRTQAVAR
jgi:hypothetical protein